MSQAKPGTRDPGRFNRTKGLSLAEKLDHYTARKPSRGCWLWSGTRIRGYGQVGHAAKRIRAHHAAWSISRRRRIPRGKVVGHSCFNPLCVRPGHLYLGTRGDVARRRNAAGRAASKKGTLNGRAKLTDAIVIRMRREFKMGRLSMARVGARFNVPDYLARPAIRGRTWAHLPGAANA